MDSAEQWGARREGQARNQGSSNKSGHEKNNNGTMGLIRLVCAASIEMFCRGLRCHNAISPLSLGTYDPVAPPPRVPARRSRRASSARAPDFGATGGFDLRKKGLDTPGCGNCVRWVRTFQMKREGREMMIARR